MTRALVVADIHGNIDALLALDEWMQRSVPFDAIWVLGDLVDYGGAPADVIDWVRTRASVVVRGNHDHAVATGSACGSSSTFLALSVSTRQFFRPRLAAEDLEYLADLPLQVELATEERHRSMLVHACPMDPMYGYVPTTSSDAVWREAIRPAGEPAFVFLGHTHDQFVRRVDTTTIVNPGSLGLPIDGDARAAFAVFDSGRVTLHRLPYDTRRAAARVDRLPIEPDVRQRLVHVIRHARLIEDAAGPPGQYV